MTRVNIRGLSNHVGESVELQGWLYNKRGSKKLALTYKIVP